MDESIAMNIAVRRPSAATGPLCAGRLRPAGRRLCAQARRVAGSIALLTVLLGGVLFADAGVVEADEFALGHAYSADGRLLYTERHRWDQHHHSVQYLYPDGRLFAVNELDFTHSFVSPSYTQSYPGTPMREGARWADDKLILFNGPREQVMSFEQPLVINAGFFHFIRAHWDDLAAGKKLVFEFAVPDRMTIVSLQIRRVSAEQSGITDADPQWHYFRVEAASRMLRWLVAPLNVAFDGQRRLMVFRGASNVKVESGATPPVQIRYDYGAADPAD